VHVEDADLLGVEQSNCSDEVALVVGAGHFVETDGSDTLTGSFVKYAVLITGPSGAVTAFKFKAHLGLRRDYCSPQPLPLIHFL
jgi:hypothetical protein